MYGPNFYVPVVNFSKYSIFIPHYTDFMRNLIPFVFTFKSIYDLTYLYITCLLHIQCIFVHMMSKNGSHFI